MDEPLAVLAGVPNLSPWILHIVVEIITETGSVDWDGGLSLFDVDMKVEAPSLCRDGERAFWLRMFSGTWNALQEQSTATCFLNEV
jgi:hypothetical protein